MTDEEIDAMEAGWQMDRAISLAVFGLEPQECLVGGHPPGCPGSIPITPYSTDIAAAWQVVEKLTCTTKQWFECAQHSTGCTATFESDPYPAYKVEADADTAALAICRAALKCCKAVAGKNGETGIASPSSELNTERV